MKKCLLIICLLLFITGCNKDGLKKSIYEIQNNKITDDFRKRFDVNDVLFMIYNVEGDNSSNYKVIDRSIIQDAFDAINSIRLKNVINNSASDNISCFMFNMNTDNIYSFCFDNKNFRYNGQVYETYNYDKLETIIKRIENSKTNQ